METFFNYYYHGGDFNLFSISHINALLTLLLMNILMVYIIRKTQSEKISNIIRITLAIILLIQELSLSIWRLSYGEWRVATSLPLHLCGIAIILAAFMLFKKSKTIYEVVYFWAIAGATQALITPDIGQYGFPHYRYFQFFVSHGLLVTAVIYATFILKFRPSAKSIYKTFVITNIYMIIIGVFNFLTGSNYLFIAHKPETASLIDLMPPWPYYIIHLELLALILFSLCYLPFTFQYLFEKFRSVETEA